MRDLAEFFLRSVSEFSERPALWVDETYYSYRALYEHARRIANGLGRAVGTAGQAPCAIMAQRSLTAYAGVLAATLTGTPFVPLNPRFPSERNYTIMTVSGASAIIADAANAPTALAIQGRLNPAPAILLPDSERPPTNLASGSVVLNASDLSSSAVKSESRLGPDDPAAYIMFTSGTTGVPKGVCVLQSNVCRYVQSMQTLLQPSPSDRFTQLFDLSFDLSVHDLFVTWASGGCLYVLPQSSALAPVEFVRRHELTFWFSVPATAAYAHKLDQLKSQAMSSLRMSLFCGEALPQSIAKAWAAAAPNSKLYNLYGPTEATIAFTTFLYRGDSPTLEGVSSVPIGTPLPEQEVVIVGETGQRVSRGQRGELWLGGTQVSAGYINNPQADTEKFVHHSFVGLNSDRWYRTGDFVSEMPNVGLIFLGRLDDQVKVSGYRVELLEIEAVLRRAAESEISAAVPWPINEMGTAEGIVAFVVASSIKDSEIIKRCAKTLPFYMVPRRIVRLEEMPISTSGKIDRQRLKHLAQNLAARPGRGSIETLAQPRSTGHTSRDG